MSPRPIRALAQVAALSLSAWVLLATPTLLTAAEPTRPGTSASSGLVASKAATQWWADITALAGDDMEGRMTGSAGYLRAADYVTSRFRTIGLTPVGTLGFLQPVALESQTVDQHASTAELVTADGAVTPLNVGTDMRIGAGGAPAADQVDAPLIFVGYGLHLPDQGYDDFDGMDLKGKVVVVLSGGPADISGAVKSNARFSQAKFLGKLGAVGLISLTTPHQVEIPWARQIALAGLPGMYLAAVGLRNTPDGFFGAAVDPARSDALFAGSGHGFSELCALADAGKPLPHFALPFRLRAHLAVTRQTLSSPNLVAKLKGRDPQLAEQYVALSAHLDHLGIGVPINGDAIYNGAMDDASGVATVLDIAQRLKKGPRPRRSILFLVFTAEEKGLLGSHFYARNPTIPKGSLVADLNFDMALPLWPLTSIYAPGEAESTLGADARAVAATQGLTMAPDPLPERNVFIRTDQFSFVREGVPALAFKFGFAKGTPQFDIEHEWRATRYHAPSDDLQQPGILKEEAVKLDAFVTALALRVANADSPPAYLPDSIFSKPLE